MKRIYNPDWYKLTKLLMKAGKIDTGLTIPFIFGAYKLLDKPFNNISDLIYELRKNQIDKYPVIQKCDRIQQHVIAVEDKNIYHKKNIKDLKLRNDKNEINLIISSNTELGKTEEAICKNLTQQYINHIESGCFSWNNTEKEWKPFTKDEIYLISSIL